MIPSRRWLLMALFCVLDGGPMSGMDLPETNSVYLSSCHVVWTSPSSGSSGSMPIGNGDIGANVWCEASGDLLFYISKTDSWSENGRLLKLGRVRITLTPNPFADGHPFRQELRLREGEIVIEAGVPEEAVTLRVWVDANRPVIQVEAEGPREFEVQAKLELWRTAKREIAQDSLEANSAWAILGDRQAWPVLVYPDTVLLAGGNRLIWHHRNRTSCYGVILQNQHLGELLPRYPDPLIRRTFGGCVQGENLSAINDQTLASTTAGKRYRISVFPLCAQTDSEKEWLERLQSQVKEVHKTDIETARREHRQWWEEFWNRSWIWLSSEREDLQPRLSAINQGYALQRWINACGGRGAFPIKFNGSIFTVDGNQTDWQEKSGETFDPDYRQWGENYWWQNTRLTYWSMPAAGDFDLMKPLFRMYMNALPMAKEITKRYYRHDGAFFPETMYFWGTANNHDYGWGHPGPDPKSPYIRYYWQGGVELAWMMIDYYHMTRDEAFLRETLLPLATEILTFYEVHWPRNDQGKIHMQPVHSLEAWWDCTNPLPDIAGLRQVLRSLLDLPKEVLADEQRERWGKMLADLPAIPVKTEGESTFLLPAERFATKNNGETPELYAVFPYRLYRIGRKDFPVAYETYRRREGRRETGGWVQDAIMAACLGLSYDAAYMVETNFTIMKHSKSRFPAFWGPNYDWIPDQDNGGVAMIALQRMLLQTDGDRILLLPAWPRPWDMDFKLHASHQTTVEGVLRDGKLKSLVLSPAHRRKNVTIIEPQ